MITLVCPNCDREFPVLPVNSTGFCSCGLNYYATLHKDEKYEGVAALGVVWTPDTEYPSSGDKPYVQSYALVRSGG